MEDEVDASKTTRIEKDVTLTEQEGVTVNVEVEEVKTKSENMFYKRAAKHYLADEPRKEHKDTSLTAAAYHNHTKILVLGKSTN